MPVKQPYLSRTPSPGEVYAFYIDRLSSYGAYQILDVDKEAHSLCYVALDYLAKEPPAKAQLESLKPYYRQAYRNHHRMEKSIISSTIVPRDYIYIGQCALKADKKCNSFSVDWPRGLAYINEELWRSFDGTARAAYKKYCDSGDFVQVHGQMFRKRSTYLTDELYQCLADADTLEAFPCITSAEVTGYSSKLEKWLHDTPLLASLSLQKAHAEILNLSGTHLNSLKLDLTGILQLTLPATLTHLILYGKPAPGFVIDDSLCTEKIDLFFSMKDSSVTEFGVSPAKITTLSISGIKELDLRIITDSYPETKHLQLDGAPGILRNISSLEQMRFLKSIYLHDLFGYDSSDLAFLSALPCLYELDFDSVPKEAGNHLKKHWKGKLDKLAVSHLREEGWLKENLENPLRHWDGDEYISQAAYNSAVKCYKNTKKQMQNVDSRDKLRAIIHQYTMHFNRLNTKYDDFIETQEREDIFSAMEQLYQECIPHWAWATAQGTNAAPTLEEVWDMMDDVRDNW